MNWTELLELLFYPSIIRAVLVGVIVALCAALLGVLLVLKGYSLIGHGLADVGFASLALSAAIGMPPMYISTPLVIVASFVIMAISQKKGVHGDVAIGIAATASLSFGVILTAVSNGSNMDMFSYMFGSILTMVYSDVLLSLCLAVVVIGLYVLSYNRLFLITSDECFARASGIPVTRYQFLISFLTAITVIMGMRMMGTLLISSLIIFPAISARKLVKSFKRLVILSACISVFCFLLGTLLSFIANLPTGASIAMVNIIFMAAVAIIKKSLKQ